MIEGGNASKFAIFQNASMYPVKGASEKIWLFVHDCGCSFAA